ncbi:unnamed protein product [Spirodela intermedia]|uniref:DRBM domain-containing protein n=1 Tax=Spirodela intermedia TaxID=51605 RepID=A0A7I8I8E5_SPIIN|nr:unnamed protein product [Spirodela intermedia]CAA6653850.1 unnamed protein product [Spirodela intermedia]
MYKQRLHELCQKKQWAKPLYTSSWIGPDHIPRFQASVTVNGVTFDGPKDVLFGTQREAQNEAARLAVDELVSSSSAAVTAAPPSPRPLAEPSIEKS